MIDLAVMVVATFLKQRATTEKDHRARDGLIGEVTYKIG